jgi:hypothetical protein
MHGGQVLRLTFLLASLTASASSSATTAFPPTPRTGEEVIAMMRERYAGKWYRTLTFTQKTTLPDGKVETWYEALELPGKLRIDVAPLDSGKTLLFRNDSLYVFEQKKLKASQPLVHPLMVLGFDVYQAPVKETVRKLKDLKFDLSKVHQTTWKGRPTYVVGASPQDTTSPQFWIDAERLYFVRSLEPSKKDSSIINETIFDKYIPLDGGWVELEVLFLANGKRQVKEEYINPKANVKLDPSIFDPGTWKAPGWVR